MTQVFDKEVHPIDVAECVALGRADFYRQEGRIPGSGLASLERLRGALADAETPKARLAALASLQNTLDFLDAQG